MGVHCSPAHHIALVTSIIPVAVFEACYTAMDAPLWRWEIPFTQGLQARVIVGGVIASSARAVIETPLEYAKVRGHTSVRRWVEM